MKMREMGRWPLFALMLSAAFAAHASESTTRLRLDPAAPAATPGPVAPATPQTPAAPLPANLKLRMPEPAKGAPIGPPGDPHVRTLADGTIDISASVLTAEVLQNESAVAKYLGKPIQTEGVLNYHAINQIGAFLGTIVRLPTGYRRFYCISFDRDSMAAARELKVGDPVVFAGLYFTFATQPKTLAAYMSTNSATLQSYDTINLSDCVILTGHPNPALARALMSAWSNTQQIAK